MKKHRLWPILPLGIVLGIMVLCVKTSQSIPSCAIQKLTGFDCPGCGGTRCARDLFHGDLISAFDHNAMLALGAILFFAGSIYLIIRVTLLGKQAPPFPHISNLWIWLGVAGIILFTILRNTPAFSWLAA